MLFAIVTLVVLSATLAYVFGGFSKLADFIEQKVFIPAYRRYSLRGGTIEASGFIIRKDTGKREPFAFKHAVTLGSQVLEKALRIATPSSTPWGRMRGAVTHPTSVRNAIADLVVDLIDAGSGAGTIQFQTSGQVEVATLTYSDPAYGSAAAGTATANSITADSNATGGTVAETHHYDSDATEVYATAVGTSGSDINISSLAVGSGDTVSMATLTYSGPS